MEHGCLSTPGPGEPRARPKSEARLANYQRRAGERRFRPSRFAAHASRYYRDHLGERYLSRLVHREGSQQPSLAARCFGQLRFGPPADELAYRSFAATVAVATGGSSGSCH
jgi:hypothetical protein